MNKPLFFLIFILVLGGCSSNSPEEFRGEGRSLSRALIAELKAIKGHDDFSYHAPKLKKLFSEQAETMVRVNKWYQEHREAPHLELSAEDLLLSQKLKEQLARVYRMEGGRKFLEKCQEEALHDLDAELRKFALETRSATESSS